MSELGTGEVHVVLYDDPRGYHALLSPGHLRCPELSKCLLTLSSDASVVNGADAVVFLGDTEIYGHNVC